MKHSMKKFLSVLLVLSMLAAVSVPAFAAPNSDQNLPIVEVTGMGMPLGYGNGDIDSAYPLNTDIAGIVKQKAPAILEKLAVASVTGKYDDYCDSLVDAIAPIYDNVRLDSNGNIPEGGPGMQMSSFSGSANGSYGVHTYHMNYDWRLDPIVLADQLNDYIEAICASNGVSKVCLIGRCLGSSIVAAYLKYHGTDRVANVIFYAPTVAGTKLCGELFSGRVVLNPNAIDAYVDYTLNSNNFIEDAELNDLLIALVSFMNAIKVLGLGTDLVQSIYDKVSDNVVPRIVRGSYGSFPSYWSMVSPKYFDEARDFVFEGVEDEYAGFIERIQKYHDEVRVPLYDDLKAYKESGVNVNVIAKYGKDMPPLFEDYACQSDNFVELSTLSFGAQDSGVHSVFSDKYLAEAKANGTDKYISADKQVNASTCLFPDSTWFIKNLDHHDFPSSVDALMLKIFCNSEQSTVNSFEEYPQYMVFTGTVEDGGKISPLTDDNLGHTSNWTDNFMQVLKNFVMSILNFFKKLFGMA